MHYVFSITLVIVMGLGAPEIGASMIGARADAAAQGASGQSPEVAESDQLSIQVVKLYQEGKVDEAIPLAKRALKLREKALGRDHLRVADAAANLALLYIAANKVGEAEQLLKRTVTIYEKDTGKDRRILAKALENLANLQASKREFNKAEDSYLRAISIREETQGAQHADLIAPLNLLADVYRRAQDHKKRVATLERVASIAEAQPPDKARELGIALQRLACAQYKNNELQAAEKTEARANHILYGEAAARPEPLALEREAFDCRFITNPRPEFPAAARGGISPGSTKIEVAVEVDETGQVVSAVMVSGPSIFKRPSEKAALNARLRPLIVDGRPVRVKGVIFHEYMVMSSTVVVPGRVIGRP